MTAFQTGRGRAIIEGTCHCGAVQWRFDGVPEAATACNCTVCRRYGVLWAYDYEDERIHVSGPTRAYVRGTRTIGFHFCPQCGCVAYWRSVEPGPDGRRRIAVNVRLAEQPDAVSGLPIDHFDGLNTFEDLPRDGKCVSDLWF
ncbi:MAG: GFA family protein [Pseudomonadales bacterium]